jgi:hypothetical protein
MKRKNEEKKPLKSKPKAKIILLIAFLLIYLPSLVHWAYGKGINKDLVRNGVIEDSINSNGYIIRNEELLEILRK